MRVFWFGNNVYDMAKVLIFQQITTFASLIISSKKCLWYGKGTNFSANHNRTIVYICIVINVYDMAKVLIFQQITTAWVLPPVRSECLWYGKGTNFSANHNMYPIRMGVLRNVYDMAKVLIFQQITTVRRYFWWFAQCLWYGKGTNFSANHNDVERYSEYGAMSMIWQRY